MPDKKEHSLITYHGGTLNGAQRYHHEPSSELLIPKQVEIGDDGIPRLVTGKAEKYVLTTIDDEPAYKYQGLVDV